MQLKLVSCLGLYDDFNVLAIMAIKIVATFANERLFYFFLLIWYGFLSI